MNLPLARYIPSFLALSGGARGYHSLPTFGTVGHIIGIGPGYFPYSQVSSSSLEYTPGLGVHPSTSHVVLFGGPILSLDLLDQLFPVQEDRNPFNVYMHENREALRALVTCLGTGDCGANQTSVVILGSPHFAAFLAGHSQGEDVWASSTMDALRELGYTIFFVRCCQGNEGATAEAGAIYRALPSLVKVVVLDGDGPIWCARTDHCVQSPTNPHGIPLHKLLSFMFWEVPGHPLGGPFTLSPENWTAIRAHGNGARNTYLGYSVQRACVQHRVVPHAQRAHRVYALGKMLRYFADPEKYAWRGADLASAGLSVVAGVVESPDASEPWTWADFPAGITNLGRLGKDEFYAELGRSKVLLGVGESQLSPSPYEALCMGVPFVNPVYGWDAANPEDRSKWWTQHDGLKDTPEPYVYHVKKGDEQALVSALKRAANTPIGSYILPRMSIDAVRQRVGEIVERDWKTRKRTRIISVTTNYDEDTVQESLHRSRERCHHHCYRELQAIMDSTRSQA